MRWKWENNAHSECKIQLSITTGNKLPHYLGPPQLVSAGLVNVIIVFVTITIVPGEPMWYSAYIFRHSTNIDSHGYLLPWRFYTLCKMSKTLERRKDRERGCDVTDIVEGVRAHILSNSCHSLLPQAHGWEPSGTDKKVGEVTWSYLSGRCQLSFLHCFHTLFAKWKWKLWREQLCGFFSTLTEVFSTRAQMAFYQSPNGALHTALPWAKACAAWKGGFQKGAHALGCSSSLECQYMFWMLHNRDF